MVVEIGDLVDLLGLMPPGKMKLAFTTILLGLSLAGSSQRLYFVLIESENHQPIYVRIGETTYSSSSIGHVILSGMADSVYTLEIGFPKDQYPSNQFVVKINKKDHGYQLKNLNDQGWVLFNYQTQELIRPVKREGMSQAGYSLIKRNDGFAKLLSQVVNDTAVLYSMVYDKPVESIAKTETKPRAEEMKPKVEDSKPKVEDTKPKVEDTKPKVEDTKLPVGAVAAKKTDVLREPEELPKQVKTVPLISKVEEVQSDSGKHILYMDNRDSVRIFIGSDQAVSKQTSTLVLKEPKKEEANPIKKEEANIIKEDKKVIAPTIAAEAANRPGDAVKSGDTLVSSAKTTQKQVNDTVVQQKKVVLINSDCKAIAWDNDVDKLRLKMLGEKDVDNKISIARKVFKTKCFSAAQIKALTELFLTDQDKYKFLDAAYPFALDTENFKQLSYLLTDEYYVKRFRTMVRLD